MDRHSTPIVLMLQERKRTTCCALDRKKMKLEASGFEPQYCVFFESVDETNYLSLCGLEVQLECKFDLPAGV